MSSLCFSARPHPLHLLAFLLLGYALPASAAASSQLATPGARNVCRQRPVTKGAIQDCGRFHADNLRLAQSAVKLRLDNVLRHVHITRVSQTINHTKQMRLQLNNERIPTPWGVSDSATRYADGIWFYSTPGHGGFNLSNERLKELHAIHGPVKTFCGQPNWFEEDCDWAYVATAFPQYFPPETTKEAWAMLDWLKKHSTRQ